MLKQKLRDELRQSMLARNELKTSVLRMLLSAINYYEIQKGGAGSVATNDDVLSVIQKEAKQRKDSIEEFKKADRIELVDKETKELAMLKAYLPQQLSEEEIRNLVKETLSQIGAKTMTDLGKVMGALMPKVKGKADGGLVSKIVREFLS